jgi:hypothetical protein
MATDPLNQTVTVHYSGGAVVAPLGLIKYVFGDVETKWLPKAGGDGKGKRKYGTSQRASARAGRVHYLHLVDGTTRSVRVIGSSKRFVDAVLLFDGGVKVTRIYTQSGTKYGQELNKTL